MSTAPSRDFIPLKALDVCSEKGCVFPAKWLVFDMWGGVSMCTAHRDSIVCGKSIEDRSTPFDKQWGENKVSSLVGASVVSKDWFECPALPYDRIPPYLWNEIKALALAGVGNRAISRLIAYGKNAVRRVILDNFPEVMDAPCPCGLSRRHSGWCKVRFANSPLRKAVMRLMQIKRFASTARAGGATLDALREAVARSFPEGMYSAITPFQTPAQVIVTPQRTTNHNYKKRESYKRGTYGLRQPRPTFDDKLLEGLVDETAFSNRKNWGERSGRQWRDRGVGVDHSIRSPHDSRGGVNKKRGRRRGAHAG